MLGFDDTYIVFRNDQNSYHGGVIVVVDKQLQQMQSWSNYCSGIYK